MPPAIEESVVVITGASSGIGRATALAFARRGASVVLAARRAPALADVAAECEGLGARALAVPTDVTDEDAVQALARRALEAFGRIDVWVNNAGVTAMGFFEAIPPDVFRRVIETNLFGVVHGARAVLPHFRERASGVLINVASVNGKAAGPYASDYVASKFGVVGFSESLRQEAILRGDDVHVCTVLPASIDTPLFQHAGNYAGRGIKPMKPVYDAEQVAETILGLVESPQREVFVGNAGRMMALMHGLVPGYFERRMAAKVDQDHFQNWPADLGRGNLFSPTGPDGIAGGWKTPGSARAMGLAAVLAAGVGLGLAAWWLASSRSRPEWARLDS
ncbi:MAG TPA: SDR family oxidoreductase [Isosphaeraceae bacterium]|jgi:short-subunit dehydrogenase